MNEALKVLAKVGPRGGNLDNPELNSDARRASLCAEVLPNGELALHRQEGWHDVAAKGVEFEKPWHRMAAYMICAGCTNIEVADAAGVHVNTVSQLRAQKWFQETMANIANSEGGAIIGAIRSHVIPAIERIAELAERGESERTRLAANIVLLEQGHGKPTQKIISDNTNRNHYSSPEDEKEAIDAELAALRSSREISE